MTKDQNFDSCNHSSSNKCCCCRPGIKTINPFLNFLRQYRTNHCGISAKQIAIDGAKVWNRMTECEKLPFVKSAEQEKIQRSCCRSTSKRKNQSYNKDESACCEWNNSKSSQDFGCCRAGVITSNPFLNFLRQYRTSHCGISANQIAIDGAKVWNRMSECERLPFVKSAEQEKIQSNCCRSTSKRKNPRYNKGQDESAGCEWNNSRSSQDFSCCRAGVITSNPFLNFLRQYRTNHCGISAKQIAINGAKVWNRMNECEKLPFVKSAEQEKIQRNCCRSSSRRKNQSYNKGQGESAGCDWNKSTSSQCCTCYRAGVITRNPFFNFLRVYRPKQWGRSIIQIAIDGSIIWNKMSKMEKQPFIKLAEQEKCCGRQKEYVIKNEFSKMFSAESRNRYRDKRSRSRSSRSRSRSRNRRLSPNVYRRETSRRNIRFICQSRCRSSSRNKLKWY